MFRVKICGITSVDDALTAAQAGADAIGLNFCSASPRICPPDVAGRIVEQLPPTVRRVGVFVNVSADEVREQFTRLRLDLVQLHGDEPPELLRALRGVPVLRAFRPGTDFAAVADYLRRCHALACMPRMVLIDGRSAHAYGGTGEKADWHALAASRPLLAGQPLVLAGGLNPDNVAEAIHAVRPWAVDVASGVEVRPGKKSADLVRRFVAAAQTAFAPVERED